MFNLGAGELLVITVLALLVLGPDRIPSAMRQMGRVMGEVRRYSNGFRGRAPRRIERRGRARADDP